MNLRKQNVSPLILSRIGVQKDPPLPVFLWQLLQMNKLAPSSASPKLLNFWSNPYKIEVMINYFIKMLELPNFGHMTTVTIYFKCVIKFCW